MVLVGVCRVVPDSLGAVTSCGVVVQRGGIFFFA